MNYCLNCGNPVKNKYCGVSCQNSHQQQGVPKHKKLIEKRSNTIKNKWKLFIVNCNICDKPIEIKEYNVNKPKKEKYYCSRSCANTHQHTDESKKKISKSIINLINGGKYPGFLEKILKEGYICKEHEIKKVNCLLCGKEFQAIDISRKYSNINVNVSEELKVGDLVRSKFGAFKDAKLKIDKLDENEASVSIQFRHMHGWSDPTFEKFDLDELEKI